MVEELEPIEELSHLRHEIHSTSCETFASDNDHEDLLGQVGDQYSTGDTIVGAVNELNKKCHLVDANVPMIHTPEISLEIESVEEVLDYYGEEPTEIDEDGECSIEDRYKAFNLLCWDWSDCIDRWSEQVRSWFGLLNDKYGSDFPD